jgi:shikimate kinase
MGAQAVFLVGFMGSGKSAVGQELARRLGWAFLDLDAIIESRAGRSIPTIFRQDGEPAFRAAETAALAGLLSDPAALPSVVALGGGAFAQQANRDLLRKHPTVFLDAPVEELWRRCRQDAADRPLGRDREKFDHLYRDRLPFYRRASVAVQTHGRGLPSICLEIESALHLRDTTASLNKKAESGESQ